MSYAPNLAAVLATSADVTILAYEESAKQGEQAALNQQLQRLHPQQHLMAVFGPEGGISQRK